METIECIHKEKITTSHGVDIGVCSECGQEVRYPVDKLQEKPTIYKLGRIGGRLVLPNPGYNLNLSPQDQEDLAAVKFERERLKSERERDKSPSATKVSKGDQVTGEVPPRPKKRHQLSKYYEDNKEALLHDYQNLTLREFFAKWHLSTVYWGKLKVRWEVQAKQAKLKKAKAQLEHRGPPSPVQTAAALKKTRIDQLPPLPAFNDQWNDKVKIAWFSAYSQFLMLEAKHCW